MCHTSYVCVCVCARYFKVLINIYIYRSSDRMCNVCIGLLHTYVEHISFYVLLKVHHNMCLKELDVMVRNGDFFTIDQALIFMKISFDTLN
jgi:hypothetical protein